MNIDEALKILYDKEINCSISSFWDGQWHVQIGDEHNGFKAESHETKIEDIAETLIAHAKEVYPAAEWGRSVVETCLPLQRLLNK